jgi:hypothetical protein
MEVELAYQAINKLTNFVPDFTNANQLKYFPRFYNDKTSCVGFSAVGADYAHTDAFVGARLVVKTEELAIYLGRQYMMEHHLMMGLNLKK